MQPIQRPITAGLPSTLLAMAALATVNVASSLAAEPGQGEQRLLLAPLESAGEGTLGTYRAESAKVELPEGVEAGPAALVVDGLEAVIEASEDSFPLDVRVISTADIPRNGEVQPAVLLTNRTRQAKTVELSLSLQANPALMDPPLPDPVKGLDHAPAATSKTIYNGEVVAENTLTDELPWTSGEGGKGTEADQIVTLDKARTITAIGWQSGDANWVSKVNVSASQDGGMFEPVPELQNVEVYKKWGTQSFPDFEPFTAKVIKLHYHDDGKEVPRIRMPSALYLYDGAADESFDLPQVGDEVAAMSRTVDVPANAYQLVTLDLTDSLPTGGYLLAVQATTDGQSKLATDQLFAAPQQLEQVDESSRFGLNTSSFDLFDENRELGIGWVRFENLKWAMASDARDHYDFTGKISPWQVNMDEYLRQYQQRGISVMGISITTPDWAQDDSEVPEKMKASRPPAEPEMYGEFAFQLMARFGQTEHPADELWTDDKKSGLGLLSIFEPWNEPNLNPRRGDNVPSYGPWTGTMEEFWPVFRAGAEGARRGDPTAMISSPGFAGMTTEIVDVLAHHQYPDGKRPIDFVDVINVHFYSGRTPPEISSRDDNNSTDLDATYPEQVRRLAEWRDANAPGDPIWLTETGYDDGGPIGTNERIQAARLPRVVTLSLAHGIDKVIVYREKGNTPAQHAAAGVLRNDGTRKPSWYTYGQLIRQLDGATDGLQLPAADENVRIYRWLRDGRPVIMAWAVTEDSPATLGHEFGSATMTDAFGRVSEKSFTSGIVLNTFPVYLSDLSDDSALQRLVQQAQQREADRSAERQAMAAREIYLFNFGKPTEPVAANIGKIRYYQSVPQSAAYDAQAGYGWEGQLPDIESYQHWIRSKTVAHSVRLKPETTFRADVKNGTYEVTLYAGGKRGESSGAVTLNGGDEDVQFSFQSDTAATARVEVTGGTLRVTNPQEVQLRWLTAERVN